MKKQTMARFVLPAVLVALTFGQGAFADIPLVKRADAQAAAKWDLTQIYPTAEKYKQEIEAVKAGMKQFDSMKGTLKNAAAIRKFYDVVEALSRTMEKASVYAYFNFSLNQADSAAQEMNSLAEATAADLGSAISFGDPEILKLSEKDIIKISQDPKMADLKMVFSQLLKRKAHTLSEPEEALLAAAQEMASTPNSIYDMLTVADYKRPVIKDENGKDLEVSGAVYARLLDSNNRAQRRAVFEAVFGNYKKINNTLGANYQAEIKKEIFFAKARKYDSTLSAALDAENIDKSIYDNLVSSVNKNIGYLHRYYAVKKKYLGLSELHLYDAYKSLVKDFKIEYSYDDANAMILKALAPLGADYIATFKKAISSRWLDVYEDDNKESGAYQWGAYDTTPFVLLNYDNSLDSALTTAHEMGHALNSWYSNKAQKYLNSSYPIFTAEVASTMNELLVMDYLIKNAKSDTEKLYLINTQIENIKGTVFQQVMYSEFEQRAHALVEGGEPASGETFNDLWAEIVKKFYGPAFSGDDLLKYGWSRIPHFYSDFYVYKYATSMSAAYSLSKEIAKGDKAAVARYLAFLGAGGSDYPVAVLKNAGVDMTTSKPVDDILAYFNALLTEMDGLLAKQK